MCQTLQKKKVQQVKPAKPSTQNKLNEKQLGQRKINDFHEFYINHISFHSNELSECQCTGKIVLS
jgi:hypothetical protein